MLNTLVLPDGPTGLLVDRSTTPATPNVEFSSAMPVARALERDADLLAATPLTNAGGQRAACAQLAGIAGGVEYVGTTIQVRPGTAAVVQASIARIQKLAEAVRQAVTQPGAPPGDIAALRRRVATLEADKARLQAQLRAGAPGQQQLLQAEETISQLEQQVNMQSRRITDMEARRDEFAAQLQAAAARTDQLSADNQTLRQRLQASQQRVAELEAQLGKPPVEPLPEPEEGPAEPRSEEVPGPTSDDADDAVDDLFFVSDTMPIVQRSRKTPLKSGDEGVIEGVAHTSIQEGKPFSVPDRPGKPIHNIGIDMGKRPKGFGWRRPVIEYTTGSFLEINTESRPWKGSVRSWKDLHGALVGYTAFLRFEFESERDPVFLSISKEVGSPQRPEGSNKWTMDSIGALQYTAKEGDVPLVYGIRYRRAPAAMEELPSDIVYSDDIYPPDEEAFAAAQIFTTDQDWSRVDGNVTLIYIVGSDEGDAQAALAEYRRVQTGIVTALGGRGISYEEAQRRKRDKLRDLARRRRILYVTHQGIRGKTVRPSASQLPDDASIAAKHVTWGQTEDDEFKDW